MSFAVADAPATGRTYECRECGRTATTPHSTGRLPVRCEECAGTVNVAGTRSNARSRATILALKARVAELEAALAFEQEADAAARDLPPGRETIGRLVRRLAMAKGKDETAQALLTLAGACRSWALVLGTDPDAA